MNTMVKISLYEDIVGLICTRNAFYAELSTKDRWHLENV